MWNNLLHIYIDEQETNGFGPTSGNAKGLSQYAPAVGLDIKPLNLIFEICYFLCINGLGFSEKLCVYHIKYAKLIAPKFNVHILYGWIRIKQSNYRNGRYVSKNVFWITNVPISGNK